jgi:hypothetical protein
VTPELATAVVLVAVMVALAIIVRNLRDRSGRQQQARRSASTAALGAVTMDADLVERRLDGRPAPVGPTRIVVAGERAPIGGAAGSTGVDDPEPPRIQLIRDASAVGIAIIVVLLIGPMIFASRTGAVLGETSPPEGAAFPSGELGPSPAAEAPPGSGRLDGEAIPSLVAPAPSPTPDPDLRATPGPRPTPNPGAAAATPTPTPAKHPTPAPTPTRRPSPTPTKKPAPTPTPPPDPTPTPPPPDPTPTPEPDPTPTPPPDPTPTPASPAP